MKNIYLGIIHNRLFSILKLFLLFIIITTTSCRDENYPTPVAATLKTNTISSITGSSALGGGIIISSAGQKISTRGICWSTKENPTIGDNKSEDKTGLDTFSCKISGLVGGTTYFVRSYATSNGGISYGNNETFATRKVPVLSTKSVTNIGGNSADCGGTIVQSFGLQITEKGVCWSTTLNPTVEDSKVTINTNEDAFTTNISGLSPGVIYHVRAYAISNEGEIGYGNDIFFSTLITDFDGNVYTSVKIGTQVWMVENFKSTHFADGSAVTAQYHSADINKEYGLSYTWNDITKSNFAPKGWHVPSDAEWKVLYEFVNTEGLKLKETGTAHWKTANGTNDTGFTALGSAHVYGATLKEETTWWSSTENSTSDGVRWVLFDNGVFGRTANDKSMRFTVRLIKDN